MVHKATPLSVTSQPACGVCLKNRSESVFSASSSVHFGCQTLLCVSTCLVYECEWIVFYYSVSMQSKTLLIQGTFLFCTSFIWGFWIVFILVVHYQEVHYNSTICAWSRFLAAGCLLCDKYDNDSVDCVKCISLKCRFQSSEHTCWGESTDSFIYW